MPYADIQDYEARYGDLSEAETARATILLGDATVYLDGVVERHGLDAEARAEALKIVCCDLVNRKMQSTGSIPISSMTHQSGAFSETVSYAVTSAKFHLYHEDEELLGIASTSIGAMFPYGADGEGA